MRSLFLRIFLWFWLAMTLVVVVLVITSPFFTRSRPGLEVWHQDAEDRAGLIVERYATHISEAGANDLPARRGQGHRRGGRSPAQAKVFIIDDEGGELYGAKVPAEVLDISYRALATGEEVSERAGTLYLVARPVKDPDGRRLAVVAAQHSPPRLIHLLEPKALAWRLGVLLLVVGCLSFWLARYLSSPVAPLRRATRRLSGGDLSARVEGSVAHRRDEIGELARDFDAMAERIEALVGSQQRLLRDVSHELRSPLARLVVALELARDRAGEAATKPLDRIEREAARLDELIGQLLLLERLEAGGAAEDAIELDLGELLAEIVADAGYEAAADREVHLTSSGSAVVNGRPRLLRSAFDNVVRNAVHHTPGGSSVEVEYREAGGALEITVRDHGPGVGADDLDRIFEPFFRVDEARDRSSGGVGLGLAIAARAVRAHEGAINAANHPDGGLVITVRLPV